MEASLLQAYAPRDPLSEYLRGEITLRKLRVMVNGIPATPDTPLGRIINGPWSDRERLLHVMAETLMNLDVNFYNAHREKGSEPRDRKPLWKPELTAYQADTATAGQAHRDVEETRAIEDHLMSL